MNLFQKKTNKEKEKDKKPLFDFDKNFEKMNKIQKKQNKEKSCVLIDGDKNPCNVALAENPHARIKR